MALTDKTILIVRLPCRKVYPIGPVYVAAFMQQVTDAPVRLLDLAPIPPQSHGRALGDAIVELHPEIIAFSWRDIQVFSPHDMDDAMRDSFAFFYDTSPLVRARAAFRGLAHILSYRTAFTHNLSLIEQACRTSEACLIAVGGPSVRVFGDRLRSHIPDRAQIIPDLADFFRQANLPLPDNMLEPKIDLRRMEESFPQWTSYRGREIGIQTKQGCPNECLYCLYGYLEGKRVRRRDPSMVAREIEDYHRRWGSTRFWFVDAQLLSDGADDEHLREILGVLRDRAVEIDWSGYMRIDRLKPPLAELIVRSGLRDIEIALNSGAQSVVDRLGMGFRVEDVIKGLDVLNGAGYNGRVMIDLSLNSPGETVDTLRETVKILDRITAIFGPDRVTPVLFFLAIQPHTALEKLALDQGYLKTGYDPLSVWPWAIKKLIYNPPPLGRMIGASCAKAFREDPEQRAAATLGLLRSQLGVVEC
jgi:hypothetical protein